MIDPTTEDVRVSIVPVRLGLKSQMTKLAAREALRAEITKQTGKIADAQEARIDHMRSTGAHAQGRGEHCRFGHLPTRSESRFPVARMNLALQLLQKLGR